MKSKQRGRAPRPLPRSCRSRFLRSQISVLHEGNRNCLISHQQQVHPAIHRGIHLTTPRAWLDPEFDSAHSAPGTRVQVSSVIRTAARFNLAPAGCRKACSLSWRVRRSSIDAVPRSMERLLRGVGCPWRAEICRSMQGCILENN